MALHVQRDGFTHAPRDVKSWLIWFSHVSGHTWRAFVVPIAIALPKYSRPPRQQAPPLLPVPVVCATGVGQASLPSDWPRDG